MAKISFLMIFLIWAAPVNADDLSLEAYLNQVKAQHKGFSGAIKNAEGAELKTSEGNLAFSPLFFSEASYTDDQSPRSSTALQGDKTVNQNYSLGVSKQTRYGLNSKVFYSVGKTHISGANPTFLPLDEYYGNSFNIEVSQSLWKNAFGAKSKSQEMAIKSQHESTMYSERYKALKILVDAEKSYWNLAMAQEIVAAQRESLDRAEQIYKYNSIRKRKNLADESDVLQAQASLELRKLEMETAKNALHSAEIQFNSARGVDSDTTNDTLDTPKIDTVLKLKIPENSGLPLDVLSAQKAKDAISENARVNLENTKPDLEVFGSAAFGSLNSEFSQATNDSFSNKNPTGTIGIRVSIPLDRSSVSNTSSGYKNEQVASELNYNRKLLEKKVAWNSLTNKLNETTIRLKIAKTLEKAQKLKLDNEKKIRKRGRSTTYQVLLFEQEYINSQVTKLRLMQEALNINSDLKTFGSL